MLDAANTLFGEKSVTWAQDFLDTLAANYGAGLQAVDFINDSAAATDAINAWVAEQTRDKIPVIIPEGLLDAATRLVLVNTLYLKAQWETPFLKSLTIDGPFTLEVGDTVQVPMMDSGSAGPVVSAVGTAGRRPSCATSGESWRCRSCCPTPAGCPMWRPRSPRADYRTSWRPSCRTGLADHPAVDLPVQQPAEARR